MGFPSWRVASGCGRRASFGEARAAVRCSRAGELKEEGTGPSTQRRPVFRIHGINTKARVNERDARGSLRVSHARLKDKPAQGFKAWEISADVEQSPDGPSALPR